MKSNYKRLGDYIRLVDVRNIDLISTELLGINIDKFFMPSVANVIGTDLRNYKLLSKGQFACNPMHVGRDEKLPIALYLSDTPAIVSPAYFVFEVTDSNLLCEYLMLWFRRLEFDRECWFYTDASVRGGISWEAICDLNLPVPEIGEQRRIVNVYNTIERRIELKRKINEKLEEQAKTLYKAWFVDFEPFHSSIDAETGIPFLWETGKLTSLMDYAGGQQPPAEQFVYEPKDRYIRLIQIRDYETDKYVTYIPESRKNKLCNEMDIMIARYGVSLGRICFGLNGAYNVALAKVFPKKDIYREYLRCFLKTDFFYNGINGSGERSAQQGFNQNGIDDFSLVIPPDEVLQKFNELLTPIISNQIQIRKTIKKLEFIKEVYLETLSC